jgi:hypothetical protein
MIYDGRFTIVRAETLTPVILSAAKNPVLLPLAAVLMDPSLRSG